jgi:hypothetical protein
VWSRKTETIEEPWQKKKKQQKKKKKSLMMKLQHGKGHEGTSIPNGQGHLDKLLCQSEKTI